MIIIKKFNLKFNNDDVPLTYKLNDKDYNKSFTLGIFENSNLIFSCRLYYLNKTLQKELNIFDSSIKYELADVFLYEMYRGKKINNIPYSKYCLNLVDNYIKTKNIKKLILWTTNNNIKAIKRYIEIGFKIEKNKIINNYYQQIAYNKFNIDKNNVAVYRT
jgi:hypothetical protein